MKTIMEITALKQTIGKHYPKISQFFHKKLEELQMPNIVQNVMGPIEQLPVFIFSGFLFCKDQIIYAQLCDGNEDWKTYPITLVSEGKKIRLQPPSVVPCIIMSGFGDQDFKEATLAHEVSHYFQTLIEGETEQPTNFDSFNEYINNRGEEVAVDCEQEYLELVKGYSGDQTQRFLKNKYFPSDK